MIVKEEEKVQTKQLRPRKLKCTLEILILTVKDVFVVKCKIITNITLTFSQTHHNHNIITIYRTKYFYLQKVNK